MATWPVRGQQAPSYWDAQLKEYVDEMPTLPAKIANAADPVGAALRANFVTLAGVAQTITSVKTFNPALTATVFENAFTIQPTINQSGAGGYRALLINAVETTTGTGPKLLIDTLVGGSSRFKINNDGHIQTYVTTLTGWAHSVSQIGEAQPRLLLRGDGYVYWGTGAATVDTALYRNGVNALKTDGSFAAASFLLGATASFLNASTLQLANAGNNNIEIGRVDGTAGASFIDFHSGATVVDHDSRIIATGGNGTNGGGNLQYSGAGHQFTGALTSASAYQTFAYLTPTVNQTGTGGYAGIYVDITETATGSGAKRIIDARVGGVNRFTVDRAGTIFSTSAGASDWVHAHYAGSEAQPRFITLASGTLNWGPGGSTAVDTTMFRSAANWLKTSGMFESNALTVGAGMATFKGGAVDAVYLQFYRDAANQNTRSAWCGYGAPGTTSFTIQNEMTNGGISLTPNGSGVVAVSGTSNLQVGGTVRPGSGATGSRPSAAGVGAGAEWYDTTLGKPIWSNGTVWKDAAGTTV